jgi:hypothetical protein
MRALLAVALFVVAACSPGPVTVDGGNEPDLAERALFDHGGSEVSAGQALTALADSLFQFDPTIDPMADAPENAQNIKRDVALQQNGCGSVSASGAVVTVSFGAAPGCTLKNGVSVSGSVAVGVSKSGATTSLTVTFTDVVSNGKAFAGELTFATTNGTTFTVRGKLTSGSTETTYNLIVTGTANSATLDGSMASTKGGQASTLMFGNVAWNRGDCYPRSGQVTFKQGVLLNMTATFTASTPTTGIVSVESGRKEYPATLPAYGKCPPG